MPTFAAIDIGANSVRLKIARLVRQRPMLVHEDREVTRLGESVFSSGVLDPKAMTHTIKVLRRFHRRVQMEGVDYVRAVATSALRDARNAKAFVDWVLARTGWRVEIISGYEEGRLIHLGVMSGTRTSARRVLLMDVGGGSGELTVSIDGEIRYMVSVPLGAVRLTQEFLRHDPPKQKELQRLREFIGEELGRVERRIVAMRPQIAIATSGTAAALASMVAASHKRSSKGAIASVSSGTVQKLAERLSRLSLPKRVELPGLGARRAEIIIAGATVFAEIMSRGVPAFRYSPLGLRDGLLAQMTADYSGESHLRRRVESERRSALLAAGKHYGVDLRYATRVRDFAAKLFRFLKKVHGLPAEYEEWVTAAAMLHEVGSYINKTGHHRHAYYIIANSEIFGYSIGQRRVIGAIARYLGKTLPAPGDRALKPLRAEDRNAVTKAVVLLRIARALDQGRRGAVTDVKPQAANGRVVLRLKVKRGGAGLELWSLNKERGYFRAVFGRELAAVVS
jgi:exopolyphosphatase/guanosine-5'-triphosphate,3'-diphosphate pyrophosphatase